MEIKREAVLDVIGLAKEYYGEETEGGEPKSVSLAEIDEEEVLKDPKRKQLFDYVEGLPPQEKAELVALMWIGRGDYEPEDWERIVKQAHSGVLERGSATGYLTEKMRLGDFLERGLAKVEKPE